LSQIRIADFGVAKSNREGVSDMDLYYDFAVPPECRSRTAMFWRLRPHDLSLEQGMPIDMWALGVVAYMLAARKVQGLGNDTLFYDIALFSESVSARRAKANNSLGINYINRLSPHAPLIYTIERCIRLRPAQRMTADDAVIMLETMLKPLRIIAHDKTWKLAPIVTLTALEERPTIILERSFSTLTIVQIWRLAIWLMFLPELKYKRGYIQSKSRIILTIGFYLVMINYTTSSSNQLLQHFEDYNGIFSKLRILNVVLSSLFSCSPALVGAAYFARYLWLTNQCTSWDPVEGDDPPFNPTTVLVRSCIVATMKFTLLPPLLPSTWTLAHRGIVTLSFAVWSDVLGLVVLLFPSCLLAFLRFLEEPRGSTPEEASHPQVSVAIPPVPSISCGSATSPADVLHLIGKELVHGPPGDTYILQHVAGVGAHSTVYAAIRQKDQARFAIKVRQIDT